MFLRGRAAEWRRELTVMKVVTSEQKTSGRWLEWTPSIFCGSYTFSFSAVQISGASDQTLNHVLNLNLCVSVSSWMQCMNCTLLDWQNECKPEAWEGIVSYYLCFVLKWMYYQAGPCFSKAYEEWFGWFQFGCRFVPNVVWAALNKDKDAFENQTLYSFYEVVNTASAFPQIYAHGTVWLYSPSVLCCPHSNWF